MAFAAFAVVGLWRPKPGKPAPSRLGVDDDRPLPQQHWWRGLRQASSATLQPRDKSYQLTEHNNCQLQHPHIPTDGAEFSRLWKVRTRTAAFPQGMQPTAHSQEHVRRKRPWCAVGARVWEQQLGVAARAWQHRCLQEAG